MNSTQPQPRSAQSSPRETFILRLWQRETVPTDWLGQVQHVHSGETAVVRNLDELTAVVKQFIDSSTGREATDSIE